MLKTMLSYAFRNLMRTRIRSFLTLLCVSLVIMLYTVLTSVGDSFTRQITTSLEHQEIDIAVQARYADTPISSVIDAPTVEAITQLKGISSYDSLLIGRKRIDDRASVFILGVSDFTAFAQRLGFSIVSGRALLDVDEEIVIGEKMAKVFALDVGDTLELGSGKKYVIVGVYASWLNFLNAGIILDLAHAQTLTLKQNSISLLLLTLDDSTKTDEIINTINRQFPQMRALESEQLPEYFGSTKSIFYFSKIVSFMTLVIALAVLLNTFVMAINERTKEVGILSAIGWSRQMIIAIFLVESLLLSFAGALAGYAFSYPMLSFLQSYFPSINAYLPQAPTLEIFGNVFLMAAFIGVMSVIFPALYATKIHIAKAIRHE